MALTNAAVKAAKPTPARYKLSDDDGLYLLVLPSGAKSWRWRSHVGGIDRIVTLGQYPAMTLAEARQARDTARGTPRGGARSLSAIVEEWHAAQAPLWKPHHSADVLESLRREVLPTLGVRPLAGITAPDILAVLRPIQARGAIELAHRLRQRLAAAWGFAIAGGEAMVNPAAGLENALMPVVRVGRRPAVLTIGDARDALRAAETTPAHPVTRLAIRLLALTALRPSELRGGVWEEIALRDAPTWRIPAARMKHIRARAATTPDHVVPLSRQAVAALEVLRPLCQGSPLMFPSWSNIRRPITDNALIYLLHRAGLGGHQSPHGWRATFSTIMNETYPADRGVIDLMLAHVPSGAVEAAYNRAVHAERRRELAQAWADMLLDGMPEAAAMLGERRKG